MNCSQSSLLLFAFTSFPRTLSYSCAQISIPSCSLLSRCPIAAPVTCPCGEHPGPCLLPCLHELFYSSSCFVSQFLIIFLVNFTPDHIFYSISPSSLSRRCLLTCRSLSWLCLSRMRTRSCSSSTVPWSRSFSSITALRRCSSSRFLSVSILICGGKRSGVGLLTFQGAERREITFPSDKRNSRKQKYALSSKVCTKSSVPV